jgi:YHS domain-containing protein
MNGKVRPVAYIAAAVAVALSLFVALAGCRKDKPVVGTQGTQTKAQQSAASPAKQEMAPAAAQETTKVAEQTTCPVMGEPIDKNIFIEYQGKKVYFCCNACPDLFKANPEKYISKLPQFAK